MKRGSKIVAYQDGKLCRTGYGEVIETRRGHHIKVRFIYQYQIIEIWVRKRKLNHGKWPHGHKQYVGWADVDLFCPWFLIEKY